MSQTQILPDGFALGKYRILSSLGSGNFGNVYKVHDTTLDAEKALKLVKVEDPNVFKEIFEARALHKCRHDNCVRVNEANIFNLNGQPYVAIDMEYLPLGSLETELTKRFIGPSEIIRHITHILFGLEHAHANGVLHKDIKPANIMLSPVNTKLSDFGLASDVGISLPPNGAGYISHKAPEMVVGGLATIQSDVFAVGSTMFRMINHITDWRNQLSDLGNWQLLVQQGTLLKTIGFQPWVARKFRAIIDKACAIDPAARYQSCAEMRQALGRLKVHVDWIRLGSLEWSGRSDGRLHSVSISLGDPTQVQYRIDNARKRSLCETAPTPEAARGGMHQRVATTTFR